MARTWSQITAVDLNGYAVPRLTYEQRNAWQEHWLGHPAQLAWERRTVVMKRLEASKDPVSDEDLVKAIDNLQRAVLEAFHVAKTWATLNLKGADDA